MSSVFSFLQPPPPPTLPPAGPGPVAAALPPPSAPVPPAPPTGLEAVPARMLAALQPFLPAPVSNLPDPSVIIVTLNDAPVGVGNIIGVERRGPLAQAEVKGGRLDAVVRFQAWAGSDVDVNTAVLQLQSRLLAGGDGLRSAGFVRFNSEASSTAQLDQAVNGWNRSVDYHVLYEYVFDTGDSAQSLIARIPIHADQEVVNSPERETSIVTDGMARWDNLGAATLAIRGRSTIRSIEALVFDAAAAPSGAITLVRTFEGAPGAPTSHPSLAAFLAAITNTSAPQRHAQVAFPDLASFLAQFTPVASPQPLGDWNLDNIPDEYSSYQLTFATPVGLPASADRVELSYGNGHESFDQVAVAYIRFR